MWIVLRLPTTNGRMALLLSLDAGSGACLARIDCQLAMFEGIFPRESWCSLIPRMKSLLNERLLLLNEFSLVLFAAFQTRFSKFEIG